MEIGVYTGIDNAFKKAIEKLHERFFPTNFIVAVESNDKAKGAIFRIGWYEDEKPTEEEVAVFFNVTLFSLMHDGDVFLAFAVFVKRKTRRSAA